MFGTIFIAAIILSCSVSEWVTCKLRAMARAGRAKPREARPEDMPDLSVAAPKQEEKRQEARQEPKGPKVDPFGGAKPVAIKELPSKAAEGDAPLEEKAAALEIKDE